MHATSLRPLFSGARAKGARLSTWYVRLYWKHLRPVMFGAVRALPHYPKSRTVKAFAVAAAGVLTVAFPQFAPYGMWAVALGIVLKAIFGVDGWGWDDLKERGAWLVLAAGIGFLGYLTLEHAETVGRLLAVGGLLGVALLALAWIVLEVLPAQTTRGAVERRGDREQRAGGVARALDIAERASSSVLVHKAPILRPSLRGQKGIKPTDVGVKLLTTGFGTRWGQQVWTSCEDTTLRIGGPRTNKSLSIACHGLDAPGALVTTSTRRDLMENVHQARMAYPDGSPRAVHVYNPAQLGGIPSTVRWSVLVDCAHYTTAMRRAHDLFPEGASTEGERWDGMARTFMPILLHAAAVSERSMTQVMDWITLAGSTDDTVLGKLRRELVGILSSVPNSRDRIGVLNGFLAYPDKTRGSVAAMMTKQLAWMADDTAREIGAAPLDTITLDVPRLILQRETLHILATNKTGALMGSLTGALVAEIEHQARQLSSNMREERLDPPVTMLLDECAVAVRLPLPEWTADMGGRGITLHMGAQSISQLRKAFGDEGAEALLGNVNALLYFGGSKNAEELARISVLTGERRQKVVGEDHDDVDSKKDGERRGEWRWVPVMSPAQISNLLQGQAVLLMRGLGGMVQGMPPLVFERKGHQRLQLDGATVPEQRQSLEDELDELLDEEEASA